MKIRGWFALALTLALHGCGGDGAAPLAPGATSPVKVMTRNLFLGSELVAIVLSNTPAEIPDNVATFWKAVQASDIPARVLLFADEIATAKPDLVGLQEVESFRVQNPSDFSFDAPAINATKVEYDFLDLLLAALQARGAHYKVAVESALSDNETPGKAADGSLFDLRMTDRDVILIRDDLPYTNPQVKTFANRLDITIAGSKGVPVKIIRGYETVDISLDGAKFTFANSHLEVGGILAAFQEAQANELVTALGNQPGKMILVGDFNSASNGSDTHSYKYLTSKFSDAYAKRHPGDTTPTCCTEITSPTFNAMTRVDLILSKGSVRIDDVTIVGTAPDKRTPSGLWPSDHAGVTALLGVGR